MATRTALEAFLTDPAVPEAAKRARRCRLQIAYNRAFRSLIELRTVAGRELTHKWVSEFLESEALKSPHGRGPDKKERKRASGMDLTSEARVKRGVREKRKAKHKRFAVLGIMLDELFWGGHKLRQAIEADKSLP